jgi:hypothetical protein
MALANIKTKTIPLGGGLDLETPPIAVAEGFALEANNIEPNLNGGYRKMLGYERIDGRAKPSDAIYYTMSVDDASLETVDTDITGSLSGATARIIAVDATNNILGLTNLSGNFQTNDELAGGATVQSVQVIGGHPDLDTGYQWLYLAQEYYRGFIQAVPGTGDVLGVWEHLGVIYAFRSDGSVVKMYKSSSAGWVEVTHFQLMEYDTGVLNEGDVVAGDTLDGLTSGAQGTVKKFVKSGGSYGSTATGYIVIDVTSGTFQSGEEIKKSAATVFTSTTTADDIQFNLGENKFRFVNTNFKGSEDNFNMYGCDGTNRAFEFDGTVLTPIITGMAVDAPTSIEAHKNYLFLAFAGGSLQHSAVADPLVWNPILGAAELALGYDIKSLKSVGGDVLLISTNKSVSGLYGTSTDDWRISLVAIDTGDVGDTLDVIGTPLIVTKRGIVRLDASQKYGNFESSTTSRRINPLLEEYLANKTLIGVNLVRDKNQYRIYFDDGKGIILAQDQLFGQGALPHFTTFSYIVFPRCLASSVGTEGTETVLFGASNGFVYQEEKGVNYDGLSSDFSLKLPFHHLGSPAVRKTFKWVNVELLTTKTTSLRMTYEFSDGQLHTATSEETTYDVTIGAAARWGEAIWDSFEWNSVSNLFPQTSIKGTGTNISLFFFGEGANDGQFTIGSITYQYANRRYLRG